MLSQLIIYFCYYLKSSTSYQKLKSFFYQLLENPNCKLKKFFDRAMITLIIFSVVFQLYGVEHENSHISSYIEMMVLIVFSLEYSLRLWVCSDNHIILIAEYEKTSYLNILFKIHTALYQAFHKKLQFLATPAAIIDLLAILPSYDSVSILRIFIIFRLFKIFRYSSSAKLFGDVLASKRFELFTLMVFTCFLIFVASVAIYIFERSSSIGTIKNLFDAFYWSIVTLATVGYGDITPSTTGGRLVAIITIFTSLGILSFFTSILIAALNDKMPALRDKRIHAEISRYQQFIIICGFGRVGQETARQLQDDNQPFIIIDRYPEKVATARSLGYLVIENDASKNEILLAAGILKGASSILCITGDDVTNVYITLSSRHLNPNIRIISRANRPENVRKLYQAGADHVIRPFEIAGLLAAEYMGQPVAFQAISGILQNQTDAVMETLLVSANSPLDDLSIGAMDLAQRKLTLLGVISDNPIHLKHKNKFQVKQKHFYFNPEPEFVLRKNDLLVLLGRKYGIDHYRDQIEQARLLNRGKS